jgi:hypothetical protein
MMNVDPNPYSPPSTEISDRAKFGIINDAAVFATCVRRTWFGRELELSGGLNVIVRYTAAGNGEKVFVNDVLVATSTIWHLSVVAPRIDFEINVGDAIVPATIRVYAAWLQLFRVIRFSLAVGGHLLYVEPDSG